jgi:5-methylcytosine-specific restriction endonuclease McrA
MGEVRTCIMCGEGGEFSVYPYTTRQGKRSIRYESRCKSCNRKRQTRYRLEHPDVIKAQHQQRDKAKLNAQVAIYRQSEHGRAMKAYHQRLRKARLRAQADDNDAIRAIYVEAMQVEKIVAVCPVFDLPELGKRMQVDHIRPLIHGGKHEAGNLQILPIGINMRKGSKWEK